MIPFSFLAVFTILCGFILKKKSSFRRLSMLIGPTFYMVCHFILFLTPNTKTPSLLNYVIVIMFLFSMSFNFAVYYVSITPSISFFTPNGSLGAAWGVAGSAIGFSQCLVPILIGAILSQTQNLSQSYRNLSALGVLLSIIPVLFAMWINYYDYEVLDFSYAHSNQSVERACPERLSNDALSISTDGSNGNDTMHDPLIETSVGK